MSETKHIAIVGGGPAGLRAAEICVATGARVTIYDAKRSVGRKLLVAGYGGLNITHGENIEDFITRYSGPNLPDGLFDKLIKAFTPSDLRQWAADLGIETFEQRTGRVYPKEMKAAPLLRRWVERLRGQGVEFHVNHRLTDIKGTTLTFNNGETHSFNAVILALGGASWQKTGSDGAWTALLESKGIQVNPLIPANCGWEVDWPQQLSEQVEGKPLKNLSVSANGIHVRGELMPTRYGFEGGAIYRLGPDIRDMDEPAICIDFKPETSKEVLMRKLESVRSNYLEAAHERLRMTDAAIALLQYHVGPIDSINSLIQGVKDLRIPLTGPRPIDEAISSAGGIAWEEIDENLMLRKLPGVFVAGEMIDWEAPTGGYLIQGCFATATHAAKAAFNYCA